MTNLYGRDFHRTITLDKFEQQLRHDSRIDWDVAVTLEQKDLFAYIRRGEHRVEDKELIRLAKKLADATDYEQAVFFNAFSRELITSCLTEFRLGCQVSRMIEELDEDSKEFFKLTHEQIDYERKNEPKEVK